MPFFFFGLWNWNTAQSRTLWIFWNVQHFKTFSNGRLYSRMRHKIDSHQTSIIWHDRKVFIFPRMFERTKHTKQTIYDTKQQKCQQTANQSKHTANKDQYYRISCAMTVHVDRTKIICLLLLLFCKIRVLYSQYHFHIVCLYIENHFKWKCKNDR